MRRRRPGSPPGLSNPAIRRSLKSSAVRKLDIGVFVSDDLSRTLTAPGARQLATQRLKRSSLLAIRRSAASAEASNAGRDAVAKLGDLEGAAPCTQVVDRNGCEKRRYVSRFPWSSFIGSTRRVIRLRALFSDGGIKWRS